MKQYFIINQNNTYGGSVSNCIDGFTYTDLEPKKGTDIWNGSEWVDSGFVNVPSQLSRMKFEMQVLITTGIELAEIISFIEALEMSELYKKLLLIRLRSATHLERYSEDLNAIAQMMGITEEQLDEIFINGNLIE